MDGGGRWQVDGYLCMMLQMKRSSRRVRGRIAGYFVCKAGHWLDAAAVSQQGSADDVGHRTMSPGRDRHFSRLFEKPGDAFVPVIKCHAAGFARLISAQQISRHTPTLTSRVGMQEVHRVHAWNGRMAQARPAQRSGDDCKSMQPWRTQTCVKAGSYRFVASHPSNPPCGHPATAIRCLVDLYRDSRDDGKLIHKHVRTVAPTLDRKSTRLNSSHKDTSRMPSSA